jgi:hypothetical protein
VPESDNASNDHPSTPERPAGIGSADDNTPTPTPERPAGTEPGASTRTRKRRRAPENWARNKRKTQREAGMQYQDIKGKKNAKRVSHGTCMKGCTFNCTTLINKADQVGIFEQFWLLNDEKKLHFYSKFVEVHVAARKRTDRHVSRRTNSFKYHFELNSEKVIVCREFFLTSLDISQSRIYYFFRTNNTATGVAISPTKGKHVKLAINPNVADGVRKHILSFPAIDSHYCRASTTRQYLDQRLSISKMYSLYVTSEHVIDGKPVKESMYRNIFNSEFNLAFFHPRKDRCDVCEAFKMLSTPSESEVANNNEHIKLKELGKSERDVDRNNFKRGLENDDTIVLCFDMENVMSLPKAEVSNFFYKRKLNSFNLTAHCSLSGKTYCAMWCEATSGRAGNNIASAIIKILQAVCLDLPQIKKIILWSDSCVPQNRNSIMSTALLMFLADPDVKIEEINQKFSEAGHGLIQEVDAIHSKIERELKKSEIYSPLSLLRLMRSISTARAPLKIIQLKKTDFFNYKAVSGCFKFNEVPYSKVKQLSYRANEPMYVRYRTSFDSPQVSVRINRLKPARKSKISPSALTPSPTGRLFPTVGLLSTPVILPPEKVKDLQSMYRYMPQVDVDYYKAVLR